MNEIGLLIFVGFMVFVFIACAIILALGNFKFIMFVTWALAWILMWSLFGFLVNFYFPGEEDESRENIATEPVHVEQSPQFESVRAERQPYRSTLSPFVLPPIKIFRGEKCVICMEDFKNGDIIQSFGVCLHKFHSSCIQHWFNRGKTTCPLCRQDLSTAINNIIISSKRPKKGFCNKAMASS